MTRQSALEWAYCRACDTAIHWSSYRGAWRHAWPHDRKDADHEAVPKDKTAPSRRHFSEQEQDRIERERLSTYRGSPGRWCEDECEHDGCQENLKDALLRSVGVWPSHDFEKLEAL